MRKVVGLDISLQKTAVCVLDRDGKLVWQGKVDSEPGPLIEQLQLWRDQIATHATRSASYPPDQSRPTRTTRAGSLR